MINIIDISKYGRTITDSRITRLVSVHELLLVYLYHSLQDKWDNETIEVVKKNLTGMPLISEGETITFNYPIKNTIGNENDFIEEVESKLEPKTTVKPTPEPAMKLQVVFKDLGDGEISHTIIPNTDMKMELKPEFELRRSKEPIKQYVYSNGDINSSLLDEENLKSKIGFKPDSRIDLRKVPMEILSSVQDLLRPASMGIDLRPIYHPSKSNIAVRAQVGIARHILLAIESGHTIMLIDNVNMNMTDETDDYDVSELLKVSSKYLNIYYTKKKRKGVTKNQ